MWIFYRDLYGLFLLFWKNLLERVRLVVGRAYAFSLLQRVFIFLRAFLILRNLWLHEWKVSFVHFTKVALVSGFYVDLMAISARPLLIFKHHLRFFNLGFIGIFEFERYWMGLTKLVKFSLFILNELGIRVSVLTVCVVYFTWWL